MYSHTVERTTCPSRRSAASSCMLSCTQNITYSVANSVSKAATPNTQVVPVWRYIQLLVKLPTRAPTKTGTCKNDILGCKITQYAQ